MAGIPADATASAGGGTYYRDAQGTWRYAATGNPVPGASDMTPSKLYNLRMIRVGEVRYVEVPRSLISRERAILGWCRAYLPQMPDDVADVVTPRDPDTGVAVVRVPWEAWATHDRVIGMLAPELAGGGA